MKDELLERLNKELKEYDIDEILDYRGTWQQNLAMEMNIRCFLGNFKHEKEPK